MTNKLFRKLRGCHGTHGCVFSSIVAGKETYLMLPDLTAAQYTKAFSVLLAESIKCAGVQPSFVFQHEEITVLIPFIVEKCGSYPSQEGRLQQIGTHSCGADFSLQESNAMAFSVGRFGEESSRLQEIFDSSDQEHGRDLDLAAYNVFLAILFQNIPQTGGGKPHLEPRETLRTAYQNPISQLPSENRHVLLYVLDLPAPFSPHSSETRMTATSLAVVFHAELLSAPGEGWQSRNTS